ncbi:methylated-DNA--[protein]-cysteine S-methyltransferase [Hoyosella altamirensis]|uniref:methylated-DNA--[protein]-cysteine S-methyltransferase n=1 Tax=Hoyosella altamirensis TaxID=616997 RepID=A0A839RKJ0_9ACTN|nr:methylated-DNA--[protein]-cysteine S-methyltransferase [Hoyosella altamirensis]MBB3036907.1 methylated-DNA-[protein]-cysteine S-methyltransferase [Hoyosella altamirensis]
MKTSDHGRLISGLGGDEAEVLARLHSRLERAAEEALLLDVAYHTLDTPLGPLLLAATPIGLVRIAYASEGHDTVLSSLAHKISPRVLRAPGRLSTAAREIDEYFAGTRTQFDLPLDLRFLGGFRLQVLDHLREIAYGRRESYAAVASAIGNPKAVRAVGSACARNPLPLVIPCHRVVRTDGTIGQYIGGAEAKNTLLTLEAA